jgi:glycerol-3-phosphate dehydrogenase
MKNRSQVLEIAANREFDLIVIGGGIAGAGIAQDAASRDLSVLLIEKDDFAAGTSSKTSKLIHGGLRYVEKLRISRTRQVAGERALLTQLAPHLIRDFSFVLPIKKQKKILSWKAKLGLTLFDFLSASTNPNHPHQNLTQKELLEAAPALTSPDLTSGVRFHDCLADDARLVLAVLKAACDDGANAINYVEVKGFAQGENGLTEVSCHDRYSGQKLRFRSKMCISAVGVWTDELLRLADPTWQKSTEFSKETHILVPPSAFETNNALLIPVENGRQISVIPWQRALLIGAHYATYTGDLNSPLPSKEDVQYLLDGVNNYGVARNLTMNDVVAAWSGVRPAARVSHSGAGDADVNSESAQGSQENNQGNKKQGSKREIKEHRIIDGPVGIVGLVGGKLSNYRLISEEVMDRAIKNATERKLSLPNLPSRTKRTMLGGWKDKDDFLTLTAGIAAKARKLSLEPATLDHLIASYGKDAQLVVDIVEKQPVLCERICPDFPPIMAEVAYCVLTEMAVSLEDVLFRRIRLAAVHQIQCRDAASKVAGLMQNLLNWDDARAALELQTLEKTIDAHTDSFRGVALTNDIR